jgi:hypothetical protein
VAGDSVGVAANDGAVRARNTTPITIAAKAKAPIAIFGAPPVKCSP